MGVNQVVLGDDTLIDLTSDTVTEDSLAVGYTAHDASGSTITGTLNPVSPTIVEKTSTDTEYILTITDTNGSYDTPNLQGQDGISGVYIGEDEPTDDTINVWIDTDDEESIDSTYDRAVAYTDSKLEDKVDTEEGKGLSTNDYDDDTKEFIEDLSGAVTVDGTSVYDASGNKIAGAVAFSSTLYTAVSTTESYTGLSVTIPANCLYSVTGKQNYNNAQPNTVSLSTSNTSNYTSTKSTYNGTYGAYIYNEITTSGKTTDAQTYYLWVGAYSSASNTVALTGFYIPCGSN